MALFPPSLATRASRRLKQLLLLAALAAGHVRMPKDNALSIYRDDPNMFTKEWPVGHLLNGTMRTELNPMDMTLYSSGIKGEQRPGALGPVFEYIYPFEWEKFYQGSQLTAFCRSWWWISYVASSAYLLFLRMGTSYMKDREAYNLKGLLAAWNLFLAVFSAIGMVRTVPHLFMMIWQFGPEYSVCRTAAVSYGWGASGFWVMLFIFSKYFELIDTLFLVIRKKKVGFLHWYHHCSVLLYCWHAFVWEMPTGIFFASMNFTVHAIMYLYYFLAAVCERPPRWALMVTVLQLSQMVFGIVVTVFHLRLMLGQSLPGCDGHIPNLAAALGMYASYFLLFAHFFYKRFGPKRGTDSPKLQKPAKKLE